MRALLVLILLTACATSEPKSPPPAPMDVKATPTVEDVTAEFMVEALRAQAIIDRLQRERDEARDVARTCETARST